MFAFVTGISIGTWESNWWQEIRCYSMSEPQGKTLFELFPKQ